MKPVPKPKPLTPKQFFALSLLMSGKPVSAPGLGGLPVCDALVKRGFATQGALVVTSWTITPRGKSATMMPSFVITDAGRAAVTSKETV